MTRRPRTAPGQRTPARRVHARGCRTPRSTHEAARPRLPPTVGGAQTPTPPAAVRRVGDSPRPPGRGASRGGSRRRGPRRLGSPTRPDVTGPPVTRDAASASRRGACGPTSARTGPSPSPPGCRTTAGTPGRPSRGGGGAPPTGTARARPPQEFAAEVEQLADVARPAGDVVVRGHAVGFPLQAGRDRQHADLARVEFEELAGRPLEGEAERDYERLVGSGGPEAGGLDEEHVRRPPRGQDAVPPHRGLAFPPAGRPALDRRVLDSALATADVVCTPSRPAGARPACPRRPPSRAPTACRRTGPCCRTPPSRRRERRGR